MKFIALLLVAFALFTNLKAYPQVFMSKKTRAKKEEEFNKAFEKIDENNQIGEVFVKGITNSVLYLTLFFSFILLLITSVVVNNPFMYAFAVIIFMLDTIMIKSSKKSISTRKFEISRATKFNLPLKTAYIIGFIILFFI